MLIRFSVISQFTNLLFSWYLPGTGVRKGLRKQAVWFQGSASLAEGGRRSSGLGNPSPFLLASVGSCPWRVPELEPMPPGALVLQWLPLRVLSSFTFQCHPTSNVSFSFCSKGTSSSLVAPLLSRNFLKNSTEILTV